MRFSFYKQLNAMDCGPTCLRMIAKHYGKHYNASTLRSRAGFNRGGVSMLGISETAEQIGFRTRSAQINFDKLLVAPVPAVLHWNKNHFVVLVDLTKRKAIIADPGRGMITYTKKEFLRYWISNRDEEFGEVGTVLLLEPTAAFYEEEGEKEHKLRWSVVAQYLKLSKKQFFLVFVSLIVTSMMQLILPFLTKSMVDVGINTHNLQFITIVLIAQLTLTLSSTVIGFIRSRLQLNISNVTNISILSDFLIKLTRLPVSYFETHQPGDTMQRIGDNRQIQSFLTGQTMSTLFSFFNFIVYATILITFNIQLFIAFAIGNFAYFGWVQLFMGIRRKLNYQSFELSSKANSATIELVQGMQEIRLNNAEQLKRWEWENIQVNVFKLGYKSMDYGQIQTIGGLFINQAKDIFISFMVAQMVVTGQLTFGAMLAVQYIIGSLSGPVSQFIGLSQVIQDAKISMERLNEVHGLEDEEPADKNLIAHLPENKDIIFDKLSFTYPGAGNEPVIEDINLIIPQGKVTAIVGVSGSGKTTLLKLLLKIYDQYDGEIKVGGSNFKNLSASFWRRQCGSVLQDGFIFNDTIAKNIAVGFEEIDKDRLLQSCRMANILTFIENLPNGFNTLLGGGGVGVSQGQKQRLLIARAVYKEPEYLFFDEATNALDANNEKEIVEHLNDFFTGRTVVVVAHRLSTVKNADKIVVLHQGKIAEEGTHKELTALKGRYYELVKNQLELGN
ncbi:peptidase domain-containing ABC transporter [Mucilaginibacter ximonensis]|uniref:Peptidase domain-containing ABC transporter n=1 Tax=Mucilaginibacter ximonensis TaxID=538021 RepID=A0ABW5YBX2_9SPHI